jgi:DNA-binding CsgD family transcriptional regulator
MKGKRLSAKAEKRILALTAEGKTQDEIARLLHCHRNTCYRVLSKFGMKLPRHGPRIPLLTPEQERQIIGLLSSGVGTGRIAEQLGIGQYRVRQFAESGFGHQRTHVTRWRELEPEVQAKIDAEICGHQNHAVDIGERFGVSDAVVLARARKILKCPKFLTGNSRPFSSHLPQRQSPSELAHE